jgi:MFS family permease
VIGIVVATFFSDVGHEMVTAVLPLYLGSIGLGAAALGVMEGVADLLFSLAKLGGGILGHQVERKKPLVTLGYLLTAVGSAAMALTTTVAPLAILRGVAWLGRGFRSPLRDFLLADEVGPTHFGRAYGVERSADMLGAVAGPLVAMVLLTAGVSLKTIILVSVGPAFVSVFSILSLTRDRAAPPSASSPSSSATSSRKLPRRFWLILGGVVLFGLGDFSRSFLVLIAAQAAGEGSVARGISTAVLLYVIHNFVSALVAYPTGRIGDRKPKLVVLACGYALGVVTNSMLAWNSSSLPWLACAIVLSGTYVAIEETIEKATVAEVLPREQRTLGLGILASANAVGDMVSSVTVGLLLSSGRSRLAFALPAIASALGTIWMIVMTRRDKKA